MTSSLKTKTLVCFVLFFSTSIFGQSVENPDQDGLEYALYSAIHFNPRVKSKQDSVESLKYDFQSSKTRRFPTAIIQGQALDNDEGQLIARLRQPLWVGGRISGSIEKAEAQLGTGGMELLHEQRTLLEETAATYANILGIRKQLENADLNIQEHTKLYELIERREAGRISSKADILLAKSRLARAQTSREQIQGQLQVALSGLESLTQKNMPAVTPVSADLLKLPNAQEIINRALEVSAAVQLKLKQVNVVEADVTLRKSDVKPSLYAVVDHDLYREDASGGQSKETRFGVVLEGSFEAGGVTNWKRVLSSKRRVRAAQMDVDVARNDVLRRANALIRERSSLQQMVKLNTTLVEATRETLASFLRQYDTGRKSWIDVLNAQNEFATSRQTQEQTKNLLLQVELRIASIMGLLDKQAGVNHESN